MKNKTIVLAVDGIDGSGKTTLIRYLKQQLENLHKEPMWQLPRPIRVYSEHVLKSTPQAEHFYGMMESSTLDDIDIALGALYHSSFHLKHILKNVKQQYDVILIDRFRPSFLAYQIHADGLSCFQDVFEAVLDSEHRQEITPDYFYLRSSLERSEKLLGKRKDKQSYHDGKSDKYKEKLLQGYDEFFYSSRYNFATNTIRVNLDLFEQEHGKGVDIFLQEMFSKFIYHYSYLPKMIRERYWEENKPKRLPSLDQEFAEETEADHEPKSLTIKC